MTYTSPNSLIELIEYLRSTRVPQPYYRAEVNTFLEMKARKKHIPLHGFFELTPFCNLDCKMCYIHLKNEQLHSNALLPSDSWIKLIDQARNIGMLRVTLTGGECLTYPDFEKVYMYLFQRGIKICLLSNGVLMDGWIHYFKKYPPASIGITLYGSCDDEYEAVTGHRVFNKVVDNIKAIKEASLPVSVSITPNSYMSNDYRSLLQTVNDLAVPFQINSSLIKPRPKTGRNKMDLSIDQYIELYKLRNEMRNIPIHPVESVEIPEPPHGESSEIVKGITCGAGRSSFTIQYDGTMCPCSGLDELRTYPLKDGFQFAWNKLNGMAENYLIPKECLECIYHDKCLLCPAMHKEALPGHCDSRVCSMTKELVKKGLMTVPSTKGASR